MSKGAFAGLHLSVQTPIPDPSRDQRLFAQERPTAPSVKVPAEPGLGKEGSREVGREGKRGSTLPPRLEPTPPTVFDINEKPYRKDSFLFTDEEFEALEDLKLELRRQYDVKATKNDIARVALAELFANYRKFAATSAIVRHLKSKLT